MLWRHLWLKSSWGTGEVRGWEWGFLHRVMAAKSSSDGQKMYLSHSLSTTANQNEAGAGPRASINPLAAGLWEVGGGDLRRSRLGKILVRTGVLTSACDQLAWMYINNLRTQMWHSSIPGPGAPKSVNKWCHAQRPSPPSSPLQPPSSASPPPEGPHPVPGATTSKDSLGPKVT